MQIEFDPVKNARNIALRDLSFEMVTDFDFANAKMWEDDRKSYPETRICALGFIESRLHFLCFTPIQNGIRVISFRKANSKERNEYDQTFTSHR